MIVLYIIVYCILIFLLYPLGLVLSLMGKPHLLRRFRPPSDIPSGGTVRLWIHAASVGEAGIAFSMAEEIKRSYTDAVVFISTVTTTGLDRIHAMNDSASRLVVDRVFIAPLDCPLVTNAFVNALRPTLFMLVETELWPSLIRSVACRGISLVVINGKISGKTLRRYLYLGFVFKNIIRTISLVCVQSRIYSKRFNMLGIPPERIEIIGNIKFDNLPGPEDYDVSSIRRSLAIREDVKVFVAGSTRPGEEDVLARSFARMAERYPDSVMIIAPRHLKRIDDVERILADNGLNFRRKTSGQPIDSSDCHVLILDTIGDLVTAYACADVAFVGGSLRAFGGHNLLEPAALGVPVVFGPYMEQTGSKELLASGGAVLAHNEDELVDVLHMFFSDEEKRMKVGAAGITTVKRFRGTLARTLRCIKDRGLLPQMDKQ